MTVKSYVLRILIGFTTINIIILLTLVVYWRSRRVVLVEPSFCSSEDALSSGNPDLLKQLIELNDKNTDRNSRCEKLSDVLKEIVKQQTANKYNSNSCPEYVPLNLEQFNCINSVREDVVMHFKQVTSYANPVQGKTAKLFWELASNSGNYLKYIQEKGTIYVQKAGKYYISSQLTTRISNSTTSFDQNDRTVRHVVHMTSFKESTERILLEHVKSMCEVTGEYGDMTTNMGAVFQLEKHDRIYVTTSHPYNLVFGSGNNHFSIHRV